MSPKLRFFILQRDGFACRYCGAPAPEVRLHVDHVTARKNGGTDDPENLVAACQDCNLGKSDSEMILLPLQRRMAVFGLMFDWLVSGEIKKPGGGDDIFDQLAQIWFWATMSPDPGHLWTAIKDARAWDAAVTQATRVVGRGFDA